MKSLFAILLLFLFVGVGCIDAERTFTSGRLEKLCNSSIPACDSQASCILRDDEFYRGHFPGGLHVLLRSELEKSKLIVRFLFTEMIFPGTEMQIRVRTPDCSDYSEEHSKNIDLFDLAGDDRILEYHLDMPERGDHLLEIFSDMNADYLMTVTIEEVK